MGGIRKIAFFSGIFHPESGGPATYLFKLCNSLTKDGYQIKLLCFGENNNYNYGYPVIRVSRRLPIFWRLICYFVQIFRLAWNADLLFVSDYGFPVALANIFLRKKTIIKIVGDFAWEKSIRDKLTIDNIDEFQIKKQNYLAEFYKKLQWFYVSKMTKIITPSNYLKKIIAGWGISADKITVIYNAIEPVERVHKKKTTDEKILLTVARLVPWKGIDKVIKILPELKQVFPKIKYQVIGDGPDLQRLQKTAQEYGVNNYMEFVGKKTNEDVLKYMENADLFVLYSDYEGMPHVVLEAMAVGLPSLVSNKGGNPEVIKLTNCGKVCSEDSELFGAIKYLLQNPMELNLNLKEFTYANLLARTTAIISS